MRRLLRMIFLACSNVKAVVLHVPHVGAFMMPLPLVKNECEDINAIMLPTFVIILISYSYFECKHREQHDVFLWKGSSLLDQHTWSPNSHQSKSQHQQQVWYLRPGAHVDLLILPKYPHWTQASPNPLAQICNMMMLKLIMKNEDAYRTSANILDIEASIAAGWWLKQVLG